MTEAYDNRGWTGAAGDGTRAGGAVGDGFRRAGDGAARVYRFASSRPSAPVRFLATVVALGLLVLLAILLIPVVVLGVLALGVIALWAKCRSLLRARGGTGSRASGRENVRVVPRRHR